MSSPRSRIVPVVAILGVLALGFFGWRRCRGGDDSKSGPAASADHARGGVDPWRSSAGGRAAGGADHADDGPEEPIVDERGNPILIAVSGHVVDIATGKPAPGVDVSFQALGVESSAASDDGGAYAISLQPGKYVVRGVGDGLFGVVDLPVKLSAADGPTRTVDVEVVRLSLVRGTVRDPRGAPLVGASVSFTGRMLGRRFTGKGLDRQLGLGAAITDDAGGYQLTVVPGDVILTADAGGATGFARIADLVPGAEATADITIDASGAIAGHVVDADGGRVEGAMVQLTVFELVNNQRSQREVTTGGDGSFRFDAVMAGDLTLEATMPDRATSGVYRHLMASGEQLRDVTLTMDAPLTLTGRVVTADGAPAADVELIAYRYKSQGKGATTRSGPDGRFELGGLGAGMYNLEARGGERGTGWIRALTAPAADLELQLAEAGAIAGQVRGPDGSPVGEFTVRITQSTMALEGKTRQGKKAGTHFSDAAGRFELPVDAPGTYHVVATAVGFSASSAEAVIVPAGGNGEVVLTLDAETTVTGRVTTSQDGKPVAGARVAAISGEGYGTLTDAQGRYTLDGVAPGLRSLRVTHPDHDPYSVDAIEVVAERDTVVDVRLPARGDDAITDAAAGIGAVVNVVKHRLKVDLVVTSGPADRAGLQPGDVIAAIDGAPTAQLRLQDAVELLRGPAGTQVQLEVERAGATLSFTVVRAQVRVSSSGAGVLAMSGGYFGAISAWYSDSGITSKGPSSPAVSAKT